MSFPPIDDDEYETAAESHDQTEPHGDGTAGWIWLITASFLAGLGAERVTHGHLFAGVVLLAASALFAVDLAAGWWYARRRPEDDGGES